MGIEGKVWRLLYATDQNFWCKARVCYKYSEWYPMECGIHQGGYLSLLKYTAFIDPLLRELEKSGIGCSIVGIPTDPVGYADDMAIATLSKTKTDKVLEVVYSHSLIWRYRYNAAKSAVLVFGETPKEHELGKKYRMFKLGKKRVPEKHTYDHVGVKNCLFYDYSERLEERISKSRRSFNSITSIGIKKRGVNMKTCSIIFWTLIIPVLTYGCELWILKGKDIEILRKFQRQIGRRCQRFPSKSVNYSAYSPLGWLSIDRLIQVRKLMFVRTITILDDDTICKRILKTRAQKYRDELIACEINANDSPISDILKVAREVGLLNEVMNMIMNGHYYSTEQWKGLVWQTIWKLGDSDCAILYKDPNPNITLYKVMEGSYYLVWWIISDSRPELISICEDMARIICDTSLLKANDYRLKGKTYGAKICTRCDMSILESAHHLIMQCHFYENERIAMYHEINLIEGDWMEDIMANSQEIMYILLGKHPEGRSFSQMAQIWTISGKHISAMYRSVIAGRS